ncbi:dihydrofolate reductase family protein [Nonomuraea sp. LPB2021202275-12-8]|uniref:dihydrofolate reductase family protein n=1 Tax=Nonomuraea sp. LPB2021202275-12-8 TaxID=3120159 RepID=UPI00300D000D
MDRPRVITHNSAAVDGRLELSPGTPIMFDERWPSSGQDGYADIMRRHRPRVLLEGSGSFVGAGQEPSPLPPADQPAGALLEDFVPDEIVARATKGWMTVPDSRGRVRWTYKEYPDEAWAGWHLLVLVAAGTPLDYLAYLRREGVPYLVVGEERVDLGGALAALRARFGVETVVATGGGRLGGALLRAGLVDEIEVEVLPMAVGGTTATALFTAPDLDRSARPAGLRLLGVEERPEGRVLLRYEVQR